ncbi:SH2 domain-containing protein 7 [Oreochromis aureus]|uniref:SH2 domain-containing protein n=1 Tax=Oreochromis aureus TaxID=47969 RepID=A0A668V261_OREAU|nr:SH2 domain-containing protein 7 [Oreochromis aureus]
MFAEMTPGSNHTVTISRKGIERNCCLLYRQQYPRIEKVCRVSQSRPKDQKQTKSPCIRTYLKFCFKDRTRMEQKDTTGDPNADGTEVRLRELTSKWFIETQVPLMVNNGLLPAWFLGFITRRDAEEILKERELGCFLIRLSEKAIGYILSYRGRDRCRHFVINQNEMGQFVVYGDTEVHDTVPSLVDYYKTSPIEPYGEYLTNSCFEALDEDLYDVIQISPKEKPVAAVSAVKNRQRKQINSSLDEQPKRPPKGNRTHEEGPPLPRRSRHLDSATNNEHEGVLYAQLRKQSPRVTPRDQHMHQDSLPRPNSSSTSKDQINGRCSPPSHPESVYSELSILDSKSRSLPLLDSSSDGEQSYRLNAPPDTPPRLSPRPVRQGNGSSSQSERTDLGSRPSSSHSLDYLSDNAVYHLAGRPGSPHTTSFDTRLSIPEERTDSVYAEVPGEAPADFTYEPIRGHKEPINPKASSNTYEPLEDMRRKQTNSSWGFKNDKWKWLFPENKKKW